MLSVVKTEQRRKARALRAQGLSVREIETELGAARSSVSLWVRDVPLSAEHRRAMLERATERRRVGRIRRSEVARDVRRRYQEEGRRLARERDGSYAAGCMLYWAEGEKHKNRLAISNSDPGLLSLFARFLRRNFDVKDEVFRLHCHLFADHLERQQKIEEFWLTTLGLPESCLRKSVVNTYSKYSKKLRKNKLPYGTCKLVVNRTQIVQTIFGSIQEYGGFERPEWLD